MAPHTLRRTAAALVAIACAAPLAASTPAAADEPDAAALMAAVEDYCGDNGCHDILPPGQNGNATLVEILGNQAFGTRPKHSSDQLDMYDDLVHDYEDLDDAKLGEYLQDASFGSPDGKPYSPRDDVSIVRDDAYGVPHVYGETRSGTMFGAGYAVAEDRLFVMDVLRNLGRGKVTPFAGGAEGNRAFEQMLWSTAPYTEEDKQAQIDRVAASGERGAQALEDVGSYIEGINAYIDESQDDRDYPGEYVLTGHKDAITQKGEIEPFTRTDVVGIASLVGALFGGGGGGEVQSAVVRLSFQNQYGEEKGDRLWDAWRTENDPEATVTVDGDFPYGASPDVATGVALPDAGSVEPYDIVHDEQGSAAGDAGAESAPKASAASTSEGDKTLADLGKGDRAALADRAEKGDLAAVEGIFNEGVLPADLAEPRGMSNALLVSGEHTASGHPVSVMGPQTGYFSPQLLMVQELQGPGISARGASFPGTSFYVQMGRGPDYAWSATSAGQDITDTFAVELCEPDGSAPDTSSRGYVDTDGSCAAFDELTVKNAWKPTVADQTPAGSYRLTALRSSYGLVESFATVGGDPVAYVSRRSTYQREVDSIIGFQQFNEPAAITSPKAFQDAAADIGYAFNWHYADADTIAFQNSGANPVRSAGTDPNLPISAGSDAGWQGWDPADNGADYTPAAEHPNTVGQDYLVNWNNKVARSYSSDWGNGSVHRGDLLDGRVAGLIDDGHSFTKSSLTQVMAEAGHTDLRGEQVLPVLLDALADADTGDPDVAAAVEALTAWQEAGAPRREAERGDGTYAHADAIRIMDAWWPLLVSAQFEPGLGKDLFTEITRSVAIDETPYGDGEHKGSSFQYGWYSYVDKDLRSVFGEDVEGGLGAKYCGGGDPGACRTVLTDTLAEAAGTPAEDVYPGGDQLGADTVQQRPLGGINMWPIAWQNRPTYQQVVEFEGGRD
ncbi:penicillin amidase [Murinocardiopsis flavida]|uniref:Penicillin amidase n=1 Tax=Murinocardiopsis flavida TaxID=645275 RepID=A0A2P8DUH1_9ACTN|nr:penicillin acylase family protein [Murinocardiopsis flavida]PSL00877.1 penicillin amidase [Murinocardiopsis flavida]